jgi:ATP-grasp domain
MSLTTKSPEGPRILLTGTNHWPVVPRLVVAFRELGVNMALLYPNRGRAVEDASGVGRIFHYDGFAPVKSLRTAIDSFDPGIIVPTCDRGVEHLHALHATSRSQGGAGQRITALIERSLGSPENFSIVSSRCELLKVAQSEGVSVPRTVKVERHSDMQLWKSVSAPPWVIKADGTWGGQGVRIAADASEAQGFASELARGPGVAKLLKDLLLNRQRDWVWYDWRQSRRPVIVQSFINGRPANCAVVCWQGKVLASVAVEVVKARGATGPASVVQVVPGVEMIEAAERIAHRLGLSGFFGLDFMIEEGTGASYLIEMNPRCTPPSPLPLGEGRNLVAALWSQMTGLPASRNLPVIKETTIVYSAQAGDDAGTADKAKVSDLVHYQPFQEQVKTMEKLLSPSLSRSALGKVVDLVRKKQPGETASITFSTTEVRTPVSKKYTAQMSS